MDTKEKILHLAQLASLKFFGYTDDNVPEEFLSLVTQALGGDTEMAHEEFFSRLAQLWRAKNQREFDALPPIPPFEEWRFII